MKLDFDKVLKKLLPDGPTIADAKVTFGWCNRRERMFADGEDTTMWCNECVQAVPAATWWEDEVVGGGPLQRVCVRVHQSACAAMDVERKNSAGLGQHKEQGKELDGAREIHEVSKAQVQPEGSRQDGGQQLPRATHGLGGWG